MFKDKVLSFVKGLIEKAILCIGGGVVMNFLLGLALGFLLGMFKDKVLSFVKGLIEKARD